MNSETTFLYDFTQHGTNKSNKPSLHWSPNPPNVLSKQVLESKFLCAENKNCFYNKIVNIRQKKNVPIVVFTVVCHPWHTGFSAVGLGSGGGGREGNGSHPPFRFIPLPK